MDPLTHGLIGASAAQSFAAKDKLRPLALTGLAAAMLADVDVFIHDPSDPLLNVELHRQFTHSLIFIPAGALIATALVWWFVRRRLSLQEVYLFSLLGYATSGVTDTLTSYGTKLLWPFVDERYAWNIISVFDPLFTLGILLPVLFSLYYRERSIARVAWGWIALYLLLGISQREHGEEAALVLAEQRGHAPERLVVKPTLGNQLLWSIRYQSGDSVYADAVRLSPLSGPRVYEGQSARLLDWKQEYANYKGTVLYEDLQRFSDLSDGYLIRHPSRDGVIGDARYAMLPTSLSPLWGVRVDTARPERHLPFLNFRDASRQVRTSFLEMLSGK